MNAKTKVSEIMQTELITVSEEDDLDKIKAMFAEYGHHHLPVVQFKKLIGLISLSDISFLIDPSSIELESIKIMVMDTSNIKAKDLMKTRLAKLDPDDHVDIAIDIFSNYPFHCLPVVKDDELLGIVSPVDIMKNLVK
jgi:acetoin utilization protein AcuB